MKAISLWQPWASAMAIGVKTIETRGWNTNYRGDIVICSAKRKPRREECFDEYGYQCALTEPLGFALCVVEIIDCVKSEAIRDSLSDPELKNGDYSNGRFAWITSNLRQLKTPISIIGRQGIFNVGLDIEAEIQKQISK